MKGRQSWNPLGNISQSFKLTEHIRTETPRETGWERLGPLLIKLSHFDKAEELYKLLLDDDCEKTVHYNQLGYVKHN
jgi:hypothetical protein